jgi:ferredoxin
MLDAHFRRLRERWEGLGRDASIILSGFIGRHPSPLIRTRPPGVQRSTAGVTSAIDPPAAGPGAAAPQSDPAVVVEDRPAVLPSQPQGAELLAEGRSYQVTVQPGQTLLEAGLEAQVPMAFSCTMGGCGTCRSKLLEGQVDLKQPNCLSDEEAAQGYILPCVSRPLESVVLSVGT